MPKRTYSESELAALAKSYREAAGKTQAEAAKELGVSRPTVAIAEGDPGASLTKLRVRMIEAYSPHKVVGPRYWLE